MLLRPEETGLQFSRPSPRPSLYLTGSADGCSRGKSTQRGGRGGCPSNRCYSFFMRSLAVVASVAAALAVADGVGAAAQKYPQAWGATQKYLSSATASCAAQPAGHLPIAGGLCTGVNIFTVKMHVLATGKYQIEVTNNVAGSNFRYFAYLLPDGMTLTRVLGARGGDCGTDSGMISCARTPAAHGHRQGDLSVEFTASGRAPTRAKGYWIHYGFVTPYLDQAPSFNDVPICDLGQKSTKAHPCLK